MALGGEARVRRMSQLRLRAVESTERSEAKVSAPATVRKEPEIFILTLHHADVALGSGGLRPTFIGVRGGLEKSDGSIGGDRA